MVEARPGAAAIGRVEVEVEVARLLRTVTIAGSGRELPGQLQRAPQKRKGQGAPSPWLAPKKQIQIEGPSSFLAICLIASI
jgi:hypothetical protein